MTHEYPRNSTFDSVTESRVTPWAASASRSGSGSSS